MIRCIRGIVFGTAIFLAALTPAAAQTRDIDFITVILRDTSLAAGVGVAHMTPLQRSALNVLLNNAYRAGATGALTAPTPPPAAGPTGPISRTGLVSRAYSSRIESDKGDAVTLDNGAVVEITSGYLGYVGYRKRALLLTNGTSCKIAIAGKRTFRCALLKAPVGRPREAEIATLSAVKGRGEILVLMDGRVIDVGSGGAIYTMLWLPASEIVILDGTEVVSLDSPDDPIFIVSIR